MLLNNKMNKVKLDVFSHSHTPGTGTAAKNHQCCKQPSVGCLRL